MTVARIPIEVSTGKCDRKWWLENNHSTVNDITDTISAVSLSKLQGDMGVRGQAEVCLMLCYYQQQSSLGNAPQWLNLCGVGH